MEKLKVHAAYDSLSSIEAESQSKTSIPVPHHADVGDLHHRMQIVPSDRGLMPFKMPQVGCWFLAPPLELITQWFGAYSWSEHRRTSLQNLATTSPISSDYGS